MEAQVNALLVGIADVFVDKSFYWPAFFSWSDSGGGTMLPWLGSGERCASSGGGSVGFPLGFNLAEKRVIAISEEGDGSENNSLEEADVEPYTEGETMVQLPTRMSMEFGHVHSYQIRPNNPPNLVLHKKAAKRGAQPPLERPEVQVRGGQAAYPRSITERVLSMSRLSGASAVAQIVGDTPLQLFEAKGNKLTKQQKRSNECTDRKAARLMEKNTGAAMNFLQSISLPTITYPLIQSSESSTLKPPEPNAPL